MTTVGLFAGVHIPNALSTTGTPSIPASYVYLQIIAAVAVGAYLCCAYALQGSVTEVAMLHGVNNLAAVVWIGRDSVLGQGAEGGARSGEACKPQVTPELTIALCAQIALYTVATSVAWGQVRQLTGQVQGPALTPDPSRRPLLTGFKAVHPIVYGHQGEGEGEKRD
jgi:hypothetical protein